MPIRITLAVLLVLTVTLARGTSNSEPDLNSIVQKMERAQAQVSIPNHVRRDYRLSRVSSGKVDSEVIAEIDFGRPASTASRNTRAAPWRTSSETCSRT